MQVDGRAGGKQVIAKSSGGAKRTSVTEHKSNVLSQTPLRIAENLAPCKSGELKQDQSKTQLMCL